MDPTNDSTTTTPPEITSKGAETRTIVSKDNATRSVPGIGPKDNATLDAALADPSITSKDNDTLKVSL